ncbi:MAG: peptide-methionine (S)-S-oxide reductase MsrA [Bradymonadaceae bacterium]|nr:peptide-methionine (S)-S-oxide reductase MsrA [Lujinxingiaceae bacterium]
MHRLTTLALLLLFALLGACSSSGGVDTPISPNSAPDQAPDQALNGTRLAPEPGQGEQLATFAGGCFWCMEPPFEKLEGVAAVLSGYTDGPERAPTYKQVSGGKTGHTEAVLVYFDPKRVGYEELLETFWRAHDPTDAGGQFADRGSQYRPGIYVHTQEQRQMAEASKRALADSARFEKPIVVPIEDAGDFWVAEDYHQDYYKKNYAHYERYRQGSGRAAFLTKTWADAP